MEHLTVGANGASLHVARLGAGPPLLLLHGWPEYWLTWAPVMERLADRYTLLAPDLRGFGDSSKPDGDWGADAHAADMVGLLDALGIGRVGVVGYDVGGSVMQPLARTAAARLAGLFLFSFSHPGAGTRMISPERLREIWYQSFHLLDLAPALVGATRESCRAYLGHFLRHWAHRPAVYDELIEAVTDTYMQPGNLAGGFAFYRGANAGRLAIAAGTAPPLPRITVPTCVRWGEHDPILPVAWMDRLGETFADLDAAPFPDVGHFPHREDPDRAAAEIAGFFGRLGYG